MFKRSLVQGGSSRCKMDVKCFMLFTVWMLPCFGAESKCRSELTSSINVTTELQSDVLLPCIFELTLLGSNRTADVAAVWSYRNITVDNVVEIKLQGGEMFWSNRDGRIKAFPKLSESGNFSILLRNVQRSDLGLYRCELYEGIGCSIAYQELHLEHNPGGSSTWLIPAAAAGGGGIVLLSLLLSSICCIRAKRHKQAHGAVSQPEPSNCVKEEETQMYATVKKGRKV